MPSCPVCRDLVFEKSENYWSVDGRDRIIITTGALCTSLRDRCMICTLLHDGIIDFIDTFDDVRVIELFGFSDSSKNGPLQVWVGSDVATYMVRSDDKAKIFELEFYTQEGLPSPWTAIGAARDISYDSSSDECFALVRSWLDDCLQNHPDCSAGTASHFPTRVLYVGNKEKDINLHTVGSDKSIKYVALSHCWGSVQTIKTRKDNFEQMEAGIPYTDLAKTYQDAIVITRRLGFEYLWIDSLCIIQDSPEEWASEAAIMGSIYENAVVTIAAEAAEDGNGGCFVPGTERNRDVLRYNWPGGDGNTYDIYVRTLQERWKSEDSGHSDRRLKKSKYSTRAWVLQECLLSPRILYYASNELAWECRTHCYCECSVEKRRPSTTGRSTLTPVSTTNSPTQIWNAWDSVVRDFTARDLTIESDRLPALSGVAEAVQRNTSGTYMCGLWKEDFPECLMWNARFDTRSGTKLETHSSQRFEQYYAPSWSWASIDGMVTSPLFRSESTKIQATAEILEFSYAAASSNPYGPARAAHLVIRGPLVQLKLRSAQGHPAQRRGRFPRHFIGKIHGTEDIHPPNPAFEVWVEPDVKGKRGYEIDMEEAHFLLVLGRSAETSSFAYSLVLRAARSDATAYERVGVLRYLGLNEINDDELRQRDGYNELMPFTNVSTVTIV